MSESISFRAVAAVAFKARASLAALTLVIAWSSFAVAQEAEKKPAPGSAEPKDATETPKDDTTAPASDEPSPSADDGDTATDDATPASAGEAEAAAATVGASLAETDPLPPEGRDLPVYTPPDAPAVTPKEAEDRDSSSQPEGDEILYSGYLPGYRRHLALGTGPNVPRVAALPGATTGGFGSPMPPTDWTFTYNGFLTASLQTTSITSPETVDGQGGIAFHVPPRTIDVYARFVSTNTLPGNWVAMRFKYGNSLVSGNISLNSWNPARPTTYYQLGSHYFMNNVFLSFTPGQIADINLRFDAGRFQAAHGTLGRWGPGMYVNPLIGTAQGNGLRTLADYKLTDSIKLIAEHNILSSPDGRIPQDSIRDPSIGWRRPLWADSWTNGIHVGADIGTSPLIEVRLHHVYNWFQDDLLQQPEDDPNTRQLDERDVKDGHISVFGGDVKVIHDTFGVLGLGASILDGKYAYPLRGFISYAGGEGEDLVNNYFGVESMGNGQLFVTAVNYEVSLGKIISYPQQFHGDGRDIFVRASAHFANVDSPHEPFSRWRIKYAGDVLYTFMKYLGVGFRFDRVEPNSLNGNETFHVLAPRIQIKSDWNSRETIQIVYAKWLYGSETRNEGSGEQIQEQLDDQLFAFNMSMWW